VIGEDPLPTYHPSCTCRGESSVADARCGAVAVQSVPRRHYIATTSGVRPSRVPLAYAFDPPRSRRWCAIARLPSSSVVLRRDALRGSTSRRSLVRAQHGPYPAKPVASWGWPRSPPSSRKRGIPHHGPCRLAVAGDEHPTPRVGASTWQRTDPGRTGSCRTWHGCPSGRTFYPAWRVVRCRPGGSFSPPAG
jgi:hypothetical protein